MIDITSSLPIRAKHGEDTKISLFEKCTDLRNKRSGEDIQDSSCAVVESCKRMRYHLKSNG